MPGALSCPLADQQSDPFSRQKNPLHYRSKNCNPSTVRALGVSCAREAMATQTIFFLFRRCTSFRHSYRGLQSQSIPLAETCPENLPPTKEKMISTGVGSFVGLLLRNFSSPGSRPGRARLITIGLSQFCEKVVFPPDPVSPELALSVFPHDFLPLPQDRISMSSEQASIGIVSIFPELC